MAGPFVVRMRLLNARLRRATYGPRRACDVQAQRAGRGAGGRAAGGRVRRRADAWRGTDLRSSDKLES